MKNKLLVATRKGLIIFQRDPVSKWKVLSAHFNGIPVSMVYEDPRDGTWWVSLDHGHWGIKLHKSKDKGNTWEEVQAPKYPEGTLVKEGIDATLKYIWAFAALGGAGKSSLLIGTEPGGLFSLDIQTAESKLNQSLWNHPSRTDQWFGGGRDYAGIHSIVLDPRNSKHMYVGISVAGVFETQDGGESWIPKNKGLKAEFLPNPDAEIGHDPHILLASSKQPDHMWQQNHCGIYKTVDGGEQWIDVSDREGEAYFGFALAMDDESPDRAWVAPAQSDEIRVPIDQKLCICRTEDGGNNWTTLNQGLPQAYAYDIVYRHCLINQQEELFFGTTTGNLFYSSDGGDHWEALHQFLPMVYCLTWAD